MRTTRLKAYAAGLAALVALVGCGSSEGGTAAPSTSRAVTVKSVLTTTASATAAATATTTAVEDPVLARIPAAARPETSAGAEAYVAFYFSEVNEAFKLADGIRLEGLASDSCELCTGMAKGVADVAVQGRRYSDDLAQVTATSPMEFTAQVRRVLIDAKQMPVAILDDSGKEVDKTEAAELRFVATLSYEEHWIITRLQRATS